MVFCTACVSPSAGCLLKLAVPVRLRVLIMSEAYRAFQYRVECNVFSRALILLGATGGSARNCF